MASLNMVTRYNDLFGRIRKASIEDVNEVFEDLKNFYSECKDYDTESVKHLINMFSDRFQQMLDDNATVYAKLFAGLEQAKNERYDFAGEKDDTAAVQTMTLQLLGSLPKVNNAANAYTINTTIDNAIKSGVVGCKAVLALIQNPVYADMVNERQKAKAVDGSKSSAQRAFESLMAKTQADYGKQCAESYHQGARLRRLNKRFDSFMKSVREDEENAANAARPLFWGGDDVAGVMKMQG